MSVELVQPISGSTLRALAGSNSRIQSRVLARPDCMADLAGRKMRASIRSSLEMVGAAGFEPATLCSQSRCATRLRYAPPPQKRLRDEAALCHASARAANGLAAPAL